MIPTRDEVRTALRAFAQSNGNAEKHEIMLRVTKTSHLDGVPDEKLAALRDALATAKHSAARMMVEAALTGRTSRIGKPSAAKPLPPHEALGALAKRVYAR